MEKALSLLAGKYWIRYTRAHVVMCEKGISVNIQETYIAGIEALKSGDRQSALILFKQVLKADPDHSDGWIGAALALKDKKRQRQCLKRALSINSDNEQAQHLLKKLESSQQVPTKSSHIVHQSTPEKDRKYPSARNTPRRFPLMVVPGVGLLLLFLIGILIILSNGSSNDTNGDRPQNGAKFIETAYPDQDLTSATSLVFIDSSRYSEIVAELESQGVFIWGHINQQALRISLPPGIQIQNVQGIGDIYTDAVSPEILSELSPEKQFILSVWNAILMPDEPLPAEIFDAESMPADFPQLFTSSHLADTGAIFPDKPIPVSLFAKLDFEAIPQNQQTPLPGCAGFARNNRPEPEPPLISMYALGRMVVNVVFVQYEPSGTFNQYDEWSFIDQVNATEAVYNALNWWENLSPHNPDGRPTLNFDVNTQSSTSERFCLASTQ